MAIADRIESRLRILCRNYEAFQLLVMGLATGILAWMLFVGWDRAQVNRAHGNEAVWIVGRYGVTYWVTHWRLFIGFVIVLGAILGLDVFRRPFQGMFRIPLFPTVEHPRHITHVRRINRVLRASFALLVLLHVPFIHLRLGTWVTVLLFALVPLPVAALYVLLYAGQLRLRIAKRAIARHAYRLRSYNVAGVGAVSEEAYDEAEHYERQPDGFEYMITGDKRGERLWKGNNALIERLAALLGVQRTAIRLFSTTTDAVAHAVKECAAALPADTAHRVLVTTDAEYGSVLTNLTQFAARHRGEARVVPVRAEIFRGATPDHIATAIIKRIDDKVSIVCLSNVCFETGFVLPVGKLLDHVAKLEAGKRPFIVIDGAQAAGHVRLEPKLLERVHFVATSGHKWLLGRQTLGILYRNPSDELAPKLSAELPTGVSLGRWAQPEELRKEVGATIAVEPRLSLNASLSDITRSAIDGIAEHGVALRRRFREQIERLQGFKVAPVVAECAMCVVEPTAGDAEGLAARLKRRGFAVGLNRADESFPATLRVCFHYYHSDLDVDSLVEAMVEESH